MRWFREKPMVFDFWRFHQWWNCSDRIPAISLTTLPIWARFYGFRSPESKFKMHCLIIRLISWLLLIFLRYFQCWHEPISSYGLLLKMHVLTQDKRDILHCGVIWYVTLMHQFLHESPFVSPPPLCQQVVRKRLLVRRVELGDHLLHVIQGDASIMAHEGHSRHQDTLNFARGDDMRAAEVLAYTGDGENEWDSWVNMW